MHLRFLDALDQLQNHPVSVDDTKDTTPRNPNSQDHLKRSILSRLVEIIMSIVGDGSSGRCNQTTIHKIKKSLHILQQNQNLQSQQIQDEFAPINLTRVQLEDNRKLLHTLELTLAQFQHVYIE